MQRDTIRTNMVFKKSITQDSSKQWAVIKYKLAPCLFLSSHQTNKVCGIFYAQEKRATKGKIKEERRAVTRLRRCDGKEGRVERCTRKKIS